MARKKLSKETIKMIDALTPEQSKQLLRLLVLDNKYENLEKPDNDFFMSFQKTTEESDPYVLDTLHSIYEDVYF